MQRLLFVGIIVKLAALCACAVPSYLSGSVSTAYYSKPQSERKFVIMRPDSFSLRDRHISDLISQKLSERGYVQVATIEEANTVVLFKYSIGQGEVSVSSRRDFVWGGKKVDSTTTYPRFFQIVIVDLEKSRIPEKLELIWQGEVYSKGSSSNISKLAEHFINVLFENFGQTVTDKNFRKIVTW